MSKLFVAVDLPSTVTAELALLQPQPLPDLRLAATSQMHLTLHYIGEAELERLVAALTTVKAPAFTFTFEGVGHFPSAKGAITLWAGIQENADLLRLHTAIAASLSVTGFRPEIRRYKPHVTLARCGLEVPPGVVDEFLGQHKGFLLADVRVDGFALYSSVLDGDVPVYQRERSFQL